jgi:hypothetical protein
MLLPPKKDSHPFSKQQVLTKSKKTFSKIAEWSEVCVSFPCQLFPLQKRKRGEKFGSSFELIPHNYTQFQREVNPIMALASMNECSHILKTLLLLLHTTSSSPKYLPTITSLNQEQHS